MKKAYMALFVVAALALSTSGYGFGLDLKKKSCETACDKTYEKCTESAKKDYDQNKDGVKKKANDLACEKAKDDCYKKCSK